MAHFFLQGSRAEHVGVGATPVEGVWRRAEIGVWPSRLVKEDSQRKPGNLFY